MHSAVQIWTRTPFQSVLKKPRSRRCVARQLVKSVATIKSVDVIVPVRRAAGGTALRLRMVTTPEPATAQLLAHLGLRLPSGSRSICDVVPKIQP